MCKFLIILFIKSIHILVISASSENNSYRGSLDWSFFSAISEEYTEFTTAEETEGDYCISCKSNCVTFCAAKNCDFGYVELRDPTGCTCPRCVSALKLMVPAKELKLFVQPCEISCTEPCNIRCRQGYRLYQDHANCRCFCVPYESQSIEVSNFTSRFRCGISRTTVVDDCGCPKYADEVSDLPVISQCYANTCINDESLICRRDEIKIYDTCRCPLCVPRIRCVYPCKEVLECDEFSEKIQDVCGCPYCAPKFQCKKAHEIECSQNETKSITKKCDCVSCLPKEEEETCTYPCRMFKCQADVVRVIDSCGCVKCLLKSNLPASYKPPSECLCAPSICTPKRFCKKANCRCGEVEILDPTGCNCPKCIPALKPVRLLNYLRLTPCKCAIPDCLPCPKVLCEEGFILVEDMSPCGCPKCVPEIYRNDFCETCAVEIHSSDTSSFDGFI